MTGKIPDEQLEWAEAELRSHADARWTFVFLHQPLWEYDERQKSSGGPGTGFQKLQEALGERDYTIFAGHHHRYLKSVRGDRKYVKLATTGGSSRLRGPEQGEFDHVAWVTMTQDGPVIANLLLDGILNDDGKP